MILRPGYYYTFMRVDETRYNKEREDSTITHHYMGELLSDSWGIGSEPKDRLLWDEDICSTDFWKYEDIYPELLNFINQSIKEGFHIHIAETVDDNNVAPNDYCIRDDKETIVKLDDPSLSHFVEEDKKLVMSSPYGQYFAHMPNRPLVTEEKIKILEGKPYFGDKEWKVGDVFLSCLLLKKVVDTNTPHQNLHVTRADDWSDSELVMVNVSHRHIKDIEREYEYVKMTSCMPTFKKKESLE